MKQRDRIFNSLRTFIANELLDGDESELTGDTALLELGVVNSMTIAMITGHIEESFGIRIASDGLVPTHWHSLDALTNFVDGLVCQSSNNPST